MGKKSLKIILLVIGLLGIASGIYGIISGQEFINYSIGLICGSGLLLGAYNIHQEEKKK